MSILSGILTIGAFQDSVISGIIMIIITLVFVFIFFIFKNNNTEIKKDIIKKQKTLKFQVAGTFLGGRQANISKFFFK